MRWRPRTRTRRFGLLEITSGLSDDSREAEERAAERRLRDLRGRVRAARADVSRTPGLEEILASDGQKAAILRTVRNHRNPEGLGLPPIGQLFTDCHASRKRLPSPMPDNSYRWSAAVAVIVTAVVLGTLLLLVVLNPSTGPSAPASTVVIGSERYSFETVTVFGPSWSNFTYQGVTFGFHVWCGPVTPGGATLCGNATEVNGSTYPFSFWEPGGPPPTQPRPWVTWISPDRLEGVQFEPDSGGLAHLLVAG